ncbi:Protein CBG26647 [Caenorhabditis briggsae]|uniref:Protein CBG26647 n=1 Tax=Caenorhabditis briggsae TaxID=6238 RepID=B6IE09_CAEBR|nr:Protein CBG26647 [Caenorhabditis briggsae]CAS01073.1 Protein CBG26647 [Caenorhabditis briggsae]
MKRKSIRTMFIEE